MALPSLRLGRLGNNLLMCKIAVDCDKSQWHIDCMETAKATTGDQTMTRKAQMTKTQMEALAKAYCAEGYTASVTKNGRHVIAIRVPEWAKELAKKAAA